MLACKGRSQSTSSGSGQGGASSSSGTAGGSADVCDGSGFTLDAVALPACDGIGPGTEDCHYRVVTDAAKCCADQPCDRLMVYWAGGEQSCETGDYDEGILQAYAKRGFVAVCAQPFTTGDDAGKFTYIAEFDRMHRLMQGIRQQVAEVWDGADLAMGGTSHGGTAPLVVIANKQAFKQYPEVWMGSSHTAVLSFDGISNPKTLEEWAGDQGFGSGCGLFHQRWVARYGDGTPLIHGCNNNACYCANPAHANDWANDTVELGASEPPSPYTCDDITAAKGDILYHFASCSGNPGANECGFFGDIVPDEQQQKAYDAMKDCPGVVASYQKYPDCSHIQCGGFKADNPCGGDAAIQWLEENGW